MKSAPLSVALIGAGGIGSFWSEALANDSSVVVRLIVDTDIERAKTFAAKFHCDAAVNARKAFENENIDAVIIATPHKYLASLTKAALTAGKHVLCEKPAGISVKEVQANVGLAKKKQKVFMVGFNHRFHPAYLRAKELCDAGAIGKLMYIRAQYGFRGRPGYENEWRFKKAISGGGELLDQGMHLIDLTRLFLGEIQHVQGSARNFYWGAVDDNAFLLLQTKTGQTAQLHASWTEIDWTHSFEIFGEKGMVRIDGLDSRYGGPERLTLHRGDRRAGKFHAPVTEIFADEKKEDSFGRELTAFRDAIRKKTKRYPTGVDAVAALRIVEKIYSKRA